MPTEEKIEALRALFVAVVVASSMSEDVDEDAKEMASHLTWSALRSFCGLTLEIARMKECDRVDAIWNNFRVKAMSCFLSFRKHDDIRFIMWRWPDYP